MVATGKSLVEQIKALDNLAGGVDVKRCAVTARKRSQRHRAAGKGAIGIVGEGACRIHAYL
jgi:hypothetical protein